MYFGGDYNPEQWDRDVWLQDIDLMLEAHVNLVTVGVFSWSAIELKEGEFDFEWLDDVLGLLHSAGIGVDLATGTASIPNWAVASYPDILPEDASGHRIGPGSRQHYSPSSPHYRRLAGHFVARLAERYARHPAVAMWHVNNEYSCHVPYDFSSSAEARFRSWLEARYGTIERVNQLWNTAVWSQRYGGFDEIVPPRRAAYSHNPGLMLDFRRFTSDTVLELFVMERDIIRATGSTAPVTTNFMDAFGPLDYWRWARELDVVSNDNYSDPRDEHAWRHAAFGRDLMRSLKPGVPWILMEQSTNAVSWRPNNAWKRPGQMAAWSEQAMARGANGIMFFQWRQSTAGAEKYHSAMVPHAGTATRVFGETCALGASVASREPQGAPAADVGVVLDWDSWWAVEQPDHPAQLDYEATVRAWHAGLVGEHHAVDLLPASGPFEGRRLVIAPLLHLLREADAAALVQFVERGGTLLTTAFCDVVDEYDRFRPGGYATQLGEVFGAVPVDFGGVTASDQVAVELGPTGGVFGVEGVMEELQVTSGEVVARFSTGLPAVVVNRFGAGLSIHVAALPDRRGVAELLAYATTLAGVESLGRDLPPEIEAVRTGSGLVLINQSGGAVTCEVGGRRMKLGPFETIRGVVASPGRSLSLSEPAGRTTVAGSEPGQVAR